MTSGNLFSGKGYHDRPWSSREGARARGYANHHSGGVRERAGGNGYVEGEHREGRREPMAVHWTPREPAGGIMSSRPGRRSAASQEVKARSAPVRKRGAARSTRSGAKVAPRPKAAGGSEVTRGKKATRKTAKIVAVAKSAATTRLMRIRELDPQAACGQGTTVMQLFRVDDLPFGDDTTHLVFFDRHGWYCAHGRECPAVAAVRKRYKQVTLTR